MTKHQFSKAFFVVFCALMALSAGRIAANQTTQPKTIILVRHAEKKVVSPENKDPDLSAEGESRAKRYPGCLAAAGLPRFTQRSSSEHSKRSSRWRSI